MATKALPTFLQDKCKEGWTCEEGLDEPDPSNWLPSVELAFVPLLRGDEDRIFGKEMRVRAQQGQVPIMGQRAGEWLLVHPCSIPSRPRDCRYILLPRTLWVNSHGIPYIPALFWNDKAWVLHFLFLMGAWYPSHYLLRET